MTNSLSNGNKNKEKKQYECIRCGFEMVEMSVCHLKCFRCGVEHDCSDKGGFW
jgi:hypothetical protein